MDLTKPAILQEDPDSPSHDNVDAASRAALERLEEHPVEQAGVVYKYPDGTYKYSTISMSVAKDKFKLAAAVPKGATLASIWHTHTSDEDLAKMFSPDDLQMSEKLKIPSYIMFKDKKIRKYIPGVSKKVRQSMGGTFQPSFFAQGDDLEDVVQQAQAGKE